MRAQAVSCAALGADRRRQMFALFRRHFGGVDRACFERDLAEKQWALLLTDGAGQLRGFSTLQEFTSRFEGQKIRVVYSGDTVVDSSARGSMALSRIWLQTVRRLGALADRRPTYWLLICSGFRTYRFLPVFWREFHPRHDRRTPPASAALMRHLARQRWGDRYDPEAGVVRLERPQILLDDGAARAGRRRDPHVDFFARANPGHARGDELVCLAEISVANLTAAGHRILRAVEALAESA